MSLSGISAKNEEQRLALEALCDPAVQAVILTGEAGSGKSLLACAYAVHAAFDLQKKVIITKAMVPIGKDIGYLPGDVNSKLAPWLGSFADNLDVLGWALEPLIETKAFEVMPIALVQGRSIRNSVVIIDEAQNLTAPVLKQLLTRVGENTKIVLLGDVKQIFLREGTSGLSDLIRTMDAHPAEFLKHIHLIQTMRSPLVEWCIQYL